MTRKKKLSAETEHPEGVTDTLEYDNDVLHEEPEYVREILKETQILYSERMAQYQSEAKFHIDLIQDLVKARGTISTDCSNWLEGLCEDDIDYEELPF